MSEVDTTHLQLSLLAPSSIHLSTGALSQRRCGYGLQCDRVSSRPTNRIASACGRLFPHLDVFRTFQLEQGPQPTCVLNGLAVLLKRSRSGKTAPLRCSLHSQQISITLSPSLMFYSKVISCFFTPKNVILHEILALSCHYLKRH